MPRFDDDEPTSRLIVEELDSVGLVAAGANGASDIMITKRLDESADKPTEKKKGPLRRLVDAIRSDSAKGVTYPSEDSEILEWALAFEEDDEIEKARNVAQWFEANIHADFTQRADSMFAEGYLTRDERISLSSAIGDALTSFASTLEDAAPDLASRDPYAMPDSGGADVALGQPWSVSTSSGNPAPTAEEDVPPTIDKQADKSDEKEAAEMPDITLSDEARAGLDDDVKEYVEQLEAQVAEDTQKSDDPPEDVLKDATPEIQAILKAQAERLEKAEKEAAEATAVAKAEREARIEKEYVEKAKSFGLIAKADEFAPIYRKAMTGEALDSEEATQLDSWLKEANEKIRVSKFYDELGSGGDATEGSARAAVEGQAAELRKSDPSLSKEQAESRVLKADRKLAARFDAEERERVAQQEGR